MRRDRIARINDRAAALNARGQTKNHEQDMYMVFVPSDYDPTSTAGLQYDPRKVVPRPKVNSKPLDGMVEREGKGLEAVRLARFEVSDLSRLTLSEADFQQCVFYLIVPADTEVTAQNVNTFAKYKLLGPINNSQRTWKIMLQEIR